MRSNGYYFWFDDTGSMSPAIAYVKVELPNIITQAVNKCIGDLGPFVFKDPVIVIHTLTFNIPLVQASIEGITARLEGGQSKASDIVKILQ